MNTYIKDLLDQNRLLSGVFVRGELSNYKMYPSGHHYFSLKDEDGTLRSVMFRREATKLRFKPENGMKVIAFGRVTVFPRDGQYQLYCSDLTPDGVGDLHVAFEQLKEKLFKQGLFDETRKKPIPKYPSKIAIITSPAGAAIQDMLRVLEARYPLAEVLLIPVRVQGAEAAAEISSALRYASANKVADLIITGRGGGSMEDLWCFNEEIVAKAIYDCEIPVISAVGHEPDVTISDYVADLRAATPSNAAELAVPDQNEIYAHLGYLEGRMVDGFERRLERARYKLTGYSKNPLLENPVQYLSNRRTELLQLKQKLSLTYNQIMAKERGNVGRIAASLDALSPLKVLGRGYMMANGENGSVVSSIHDVADGESLALRLKDGVLDCNVTQRREI